MKPRKVRLKKKHQQEVVTKKGTFLFVLLIVFAVVGFVFAIRYGVAYKDAQLIGSSDLKTRGLYYQLKMERTSYRVGEPIGVQLSVTNITSEPITLIFEKNLEFDLTVRKEVNLLFAQVPKTIWKLSDTQMIVPDPHHLDLEAGQTLTFSGVWNQKDREGSNVRPGQYQIIGHLMAKDRNESLQLRSRTGGSE